MSRYEIPRTVVNRLLGAAQRLAPRECVGVLSGQGGRILEWHPLTNIAPEEDRFLADPTEQIQLFRRLREAGREVMAICHSHPRGGGAPSATDLAEAWYPGALYLVVAMGVDGRLDLNGYLLREGRAEPQELTVVSSA